MYHFSLIRITILCFVVATGIMAPSWGQGAEKVAKFASLGKSEELVLTFTTTGCFHFASYQLTVRRDAKAADLIGVKIVQTKQMNAPGGGPESKEPVELGELKLTKADLEGLDNLIDFYRSGPKNTCTTVDEITISYRHEGKEVATEKFKDGSCSTHDKKELTRIADLIARLVKKD